MHPCGWVYIITEILPIILCEWAWAFSCYLAIITFLMDIVHCICVCVWLSIWTLSALSYILYYYTMIIRFQHSVLSLSASIVRSNVYYNIITIVQRGRVKEELKDWNSWQTHRSNNRVAIPVLTASPLNMYKLKCDCTQYITYTQCTLLLDKSLLQHRPIACRWPDVF